MKDSVSIMTGSLNLFCQGDNQALAYLYNAWLPEFYLVAYRYVQSEQESEDVVADCFEKLFKMSIDKRKQKFIEEEINIKALLLVMVKNQSLDVVKTRNNRTRIIDGIKKWIPTVGFNDSKQTLTEDNFKNLIACLPEKEKVILSLTMEGYSNEEISKQLELSEKTVANLLSMARKKVKGLWAGFMG